MTISHRTVNTKTTTEEVTKVLLLKISHICDDVFVWCFLYFVFYVFICVFLLVGFSTVQLARK